MEFLTLFEWSLTELCHAYEARNFVPLLESDVAGYLYYILVQKNDGDASQLHLSARIKKIDEHRKFPDLVIGPVLSTPEQLDAYTTNIKSGSMNLRVSREEALRLVNLKDFKDLIKPHIGQMEAAVEIKPFLQGFSYQQLWHRAVKAREDIEALAYRIDASNRVLLIFDEVGYLPKAPKDNSLKELVKLKNEKDAAIQIVYISVSTQGTCSWQFLD